MLSAQAVSTSKGQEAILLAVEAVHITLVAVVTKVACPKAVVVVAVAPLLAVARTFGPVSVYSITNNNEFSAAVTMGGRNMINARPQSLKLVGEAQISVKSQALTEEDKGLVKEAIAYA